MHAVVVKVKLPTGRTIEEGKQQLETLVLPMVRQNPGVLNGYWLAPPQGEEGLSVVLFDNEANARAALDRVQTPPDVQLVHKEVREVVASL
jgi:hypothetical protein